MGQHAYYPSTQQDHENKTILSCIVRETGKEMGEGGRESEREGGGGKKGKKRERGESKPVSTIKETG